MPQEPPAPVNRLERRKQRKLTKLRSGNEETFKWTFLTFIFVFFCCIFAI